MASVTVLLLASWSRTRLRPVRRGVGLGRQPGDGLEDAVEVVGAESGGAAPARPGVGVSSASSINRQASATRAAYGCFERRLVRLAPLAGAEAGRLGVGRASRESGRSSAWPAGRRRTAGSRRRSSPPSSRSCHPQTRSRATTAAQRGSCSTGCWSCGRSIASVFMIGSLHPCREGKFAIPAQPQHSAACCRIERTVRGPPLRR